MDTNFNQFSDEYDEDDEDDESIENQYVIRPNKSALKREHVKIQNQAEALIQMPMSKMEKLIEDENLQHQIVIGKKMKGSAYKRHIKHLANLLSSLDNELLSQLLMDDKEKQAELNRHFQRLEVMRDKLISQNEDFLNELLQQFPQLDRQQLRNLIRQALREKETEKPPKASRLIFKLLREQLEDE